MIISFSGLPTHFDPKQIIFSSVLMIICEFRQQKLFELLLCTRHCARNPEKRDGSHDIYINTQESQGHAKIQVGTRNSKGQKRRC